MASVFRGKPDWLKPQPATTLQLGRTRRLLAEEHLPTVCESARCPNRENCYSAATAAFLILGPGCTRNCRFCSVEKAGQGQDTLLDDQPGLSAAEGYQKSLPVDPEEPLKIARAVRQLGLSYVVITSTTRDDLPDGGAEQFASTIRAVKQHNPGCLVEVLIPDLVGSRNLIWQNLRDVLAAWPVVLGHNLETVPALYPKVRPGADYRLSLEILRRAKNEHPCLLTKSSLVLGLGESAAEVQAVLEDLRRAECDIVVLGQYLQPTREQLAVAKYLEPVEFEFLKRRGESMGLPAVLAGPLYRSSYKAAEIYRRLTQ